MLFLCQWKVAPIREKKSTSLIWYFLFAMSVSALFPHFDIFGVGEFDSTTVSTGEFMT